LVTLEDQVWDKCLDCGERLPFQAWDDTHST
jgi:hypothetical protein